MKKLLIFIGILVGVPFCIHAQNEMYFFSSSKNKENSEKSTLTKKQKETPEKPRVQTADDQVRHFYVPSAGSTKVVHESELSRDALDEYNRRGQVLIAGDDEYGYIPPTQDGEWLNRGYEGSMSDYEDAERIIRTRDRRYAIDVNSPYYYDMVYGANSWDWNVYVDNRYAYVFPRQTNVMWSSWKFGRGARFGMSFGYSGYYDPWYSPYYPGYGYGGWGYGGGWGYPSYGWGGHSHWGGWYDPYYPSYGWGGGYYYGPSRRRGYRDNRSSVGSNIGSTRDRRRSVGSSRNDRGSISSTRNSSRRTNNNATSITRPVNGSFGSGNSSSTGNGRDRVGDVRARNSSTTTRVRSNSQSVNNGSTFRYTRPSSTRGNSTRSTRNRESYSNSSSTRNNSSSRSNYNTRSSNINRTNSNSSSSTRNSSSFSPSSSSRSSGSSTRSSGGSSRSGSTRSR